MRNNAAVCVALQYSSGTPKAEQHYANTNRCMMHINPTFTVSGPMQAVISVT